jgi:hypothetical protein
MNASDCSPRSSEPFDIGIAGSGFFARYEEYRGRCFGDVGFVPGAGDLDFWVLNARSDASSMSILCRTTV